MKKLMFLAMVAILLVGCKKDEPAGPQSLKFTISKVKDAPLAKDVAKFGMYYRKNPKDPEDNTVVLFTDAAWNGSEVSFDLSGDKHPPLVPLLDVLGVNIDQYTVTLSRADVQANAISFISAISHDGKRQGLLSQYTGESNYFPSLFFVSEDVNVKLVDKVDSKKNFELNVKKGWNFIVLNLSTMSLAISDPNTLSWGYSNK